MQGKEGPSQKEDKDNVKTKKSERYFKEKR